ncbi:MULTISPECIES: hypothetical protein [unclassified Mesorhizobium]|uniref:hypothetical protein n=1 Tax=unclassified Mesorhizobium TaxID=325217 RepID=UPI0030154CF6
MTLGKIYTLTEVAEHLRITNRALAKTAKRHGLCMINGREMLFSEEDVEGIKQAMRATPTEPPRHKVTPSLSDYQLHKSLVNLTRKKGSKLRKIALEQSQRPSARKHLKEEFGE